MNKKEQNSSKELTGSNSLQHSLSKFIKIQVVNNIYLLCCDDGVHGQYLPNAIYTHHFIHIHHA